MANYRRYGYNKRYTRKYRKTRKPSANPIKRYVGKRRNIKYGNMYRDVQMLKGLINTEIKYLDQSRNNGVDGYWDIVPSATQGLPDVEAGPPTPGYVSFMVDYPNQGDDFNQREGRSIKLKSIQLKGQIRVPNGTSSNQRGQCRIMIIVDHQCQTNEDTDPVPILYSLDNNNQYSMMSRINRQQNKRYSILATRKLSFSQSYFSHSINIYKRLDDKVKFNGVNNQNFMDKAFHIVVLADGEFPNVGSNDIQSNYVAQFETRITYVDN